MYKKEREGTGKSKGTQIDQMNDFHQEKKKKEEEQLAKLKGKTIHVPTDGNEKRKKRLNLNKIRIAILV